ncbi:MAG: GNAT family N-acetyltransferase [Clostridia bacterium]|nr:GNAT family N-acetyltransferase [Clostridia bacterium]
MQYRRLAREELNELKKLQSIVYFMKYDEKEEASSAWLDELRWESSRGAFTDEGKLAAVMEIIPFKAYLDGKAVGSSGIAGVAALLEHRRGGAVKTLLKNAYKEMYEKGDVMSYLYPFSHEYYRKYGYEQGSFSNLAKVDIKQLKEVRIPGYTKQYFPGECMDDIKSVYADFARNYNCCIARDEWRWKQLFSNDPYKTKERIFVRYNEDKKPIAYLRMQANQVAAYTHDLVVIEAAWSGAEGILGLLAIVQGYSGDLRKLEMDVPGDFPIELLVKENWSLEISRRRTGMSRIINIEKALETIRKPSEPGRAVIGVIDEYAPWNTENWAVEWNGGDCGVSKTGEEADIVCEAASLSQLVTGYLPLGSMMVRSDISVKSNEEVLGKLFVKKPCFIWDRF